MKFSFKKFWRFLHLVLEDKEQNRKNAIADEAISNYVNRHR